MRYLLIIGLCFSLLVSCTKSGDTNDGSGTGGTGGGHEYNPTDSLPPEIIIYSPTASQVFSSSQTINITGKVTDDYGLYRGSIKVVNDANGNEVKFQAYEIHGLKAYDFSLPCQSAVTTASDYTIIISFEDHGLNSTTKTVKVKMNP